MCLKVNKTAKVKTAILPIIVYKKGPLSLKESFESDCRIFTYKSLLKTEHVNIIVDRFDEVDKGYHSFRFLINREGLPNGVFIIPKDAKYINGKNNGRSYGRVSSSLVYIGPLSFKNYFKALLVKFSILKIK